MSIERDWLDALRATEGALWSGWSAVAYVTEPEHWPAFAAFAEQQTPGMTWGETERIMMLRDGRVLLEFAKKAEEKLGNER